ncbi:hypothetical protein MFLAVUS_007192 [Mucor flavus]|uniref:Uncharacterized protein n=1 Tax=Mucor flavus TaxID=439312 RepID=A0ABP9Z3M4_9FUNG
MCDFTTEAANMDPAPMSAYASELSNALDKAPLSTRALHETLYDVGYRKDFDLVAHDDANFMEIAIRKIDATMEIPNTPRKLKAFIKEIPSILAWKEAVTSHALNLN